MKPCCLLSFAARVQCVGWTPWWKSGWGCRRKNTYALVSSPNDNHKSNCRPWFGLISIRRLHNRLHRPMGPHKLVQHIKGREEPFRLSDNKLPTIIASMLVNSTIDWVTSPMCCTHVDLFEATLDFYNFWRILGSRLFLFVRFWENCNGSGHLGQAF